MRVGLLRGYEKKEWSKKGSEERPVLFISGKGTLKTDSGSRLLDIYGGRIYPAGAFSTSRSSSKGLSSSAGWRVPLQLSKRSEPCT